MSDPVSLRHAFKLPPKDAIAYFESKGYTISWDWWDTWQDAHAKAFTLAKAASVDILEDVRTVFDEGLKAGLTEREIVKTLEPKLRAKGWWGRLPLLDDDGAQLIAANGKPQTYLAGTPWRLKNAWRTNKRVALNTGRYKQQKAIAEARPYWQYVAILDSRVRPSHAALNGRVYRHDDPIWDSHYPPNGWGCRCRVRTLSQAALDRRDLPLSDSDGELTDIEQNVGVDKRTGEQITAPGKRWTDPATGDALTPDPGWSHNAARAGADQLSRDLAAKAQAAGVTVPASAPAARAAVAVTRLRSQIRDAETFIEKTNLAEDWVEARSTKTPRSIAFRTIDEPEDLVRVRWEGLDILYPPGWQGRERAAMLIVSIVNSGAPRRLTRTAGTIRFFRQSNKWDGHWAEKYNIPNFKSLATGGVDGVGVYGNNSIGASHYIHELGHTFAYAKYGSATPAPGGAFARAAASGEAPLTEYAKAGGIVEDFAESISLYFTERTRMRREAPQRYKVIKRLMEEEDFDG